MPPPPTNNFRKTYVTPTNYISSEREFIGESESSKILRKYFDFAILSAIFAKLSDFRPFLEVRKNFKLLEHKHSIYHFKAGDLEIPNI